MSSPDGHDLQAVLWDMDGTLVDTEPDWMAAQDDLARKHGLAWARTGPRPELTMCKFSGRSHQRSANSLEGFARSFGNSPTRLASHIIQNPYTDTLNAKTDIWIENGDYCPLSVNLAVLTWETASSTDSGPAF